MTSDFTFSLEGYTDLVNLPSEMITFGTYRISYEPPEGALESDVNMSISSEADMNQMLDFFKSFLMAAGYPVGFEQSLEVTGEGQDDIDSLNFSFGDDILTFSGSNTTGYGIV